MNARRAMRWYWQANRDIWDGLAYTITGRALFWAAFWALWLAWVLHGA